MMLILGVVLGLSAFSVNPVVGECDVTCPRDPSGTCYDVSLPNPSDCASFCQCVDCKPVMKGCQGGTYYDLTSEACVEITLSGCVEPRQELTTDFSVPPTTPLVIGATLAAFAVNYYEKFDMQNPLLYDEILVNRGMSLNPTSYQMLLPGHGLYLVALTAGAGPRTRVDFHLREEGISTLNILRVSNTHQGQETIGRDMILRFSQGETIWTSSHSDRLYSDTFGVHTSWATFSLTGGLLGINIAFSVGRTTNYQSGIVQFNHILANEGGGWDPNNNRFTAPVTGVYYFMYSVGVGRGVQVETKLTMEGFDIASLTRNDTTHNDIDTLGRGVILSLSSGEFVQLNSNHPGVSDNLMQTSFSGFLYSPAHGQRLAWGAYRTMSWEDPFNPMAPVTYDWVTVDVGGAWNINHAVCLVSGSYFVHFSAGALPGLPVEVTLMRAGYPMAKLVKSGTGHTGSDTLSRSVVLHCDAGDLLWLEANAGTGLYSSFELQTGFSGFLIYPAP